ncbi:pyroglutamyl-peptidase [Fistulifera solaris]|uniref:Pyroglutamyl-peptidase n=1 Tax=Fistulifera solaris TaxID=1519565 RepID=A0A1Z5KDS0_FISSO|nr:pyroglutamyl-peptidase [Fistulifera solaris]|eukprot:GAX24272.1 pyroglutamyl-peptidase [Fistulifera solaris]
MISANSSIHDDIKRSLRFVVTGFGPFGGVPENPTTVLANGIVDYLNQHGMNDLALITSTFVLETSAEAARAAIDKFWEDEQANEYSEQTTTILLHLGVNYKGEKFHLESCAYNEATFRIPDERGYQPNKESILGEDISVGRALETLLDVNSLVEQLNYTIEKHESESMSVCRKNSILSNDPGRFVCNYIYCYSLDKFKSHKLQIVSNDPRGGTRCLFLHVPPVDVVPQDQQFWFVARLMEMLYEDQLKS